MSALTPRETTAGEWFTARQRGERLEAHRLPDDPSCDFCGGDAFADDWSAIASAFICTSCVEAALASRQLEITP